MTSEPKLRRPNPLRKYKAGRQHIERIHEAAVAAAVQAREIYQQTIQDLMDEEAVRRGFVFVPLPPSGGDISEIDDMKQEAEEALRKARKDGAEKADEDEMSGLIEDVMTAEVSWSAAEEQARARDMLQTAIRNRASRLEQEKQKVRKAVYEECKDLGVWYGHKAHTLATKVGHGLKGIFKKSSDQSACAAFKEHFNESSGLKLPQRLKKYQINTPPKDETGDLPVPKPG